MFSLYLVTCIAALARLQIVGPVGQRFKGFARKELASLADEGRGRDLYETFRNGLVHEARIKSGAQFSLDFDPVFTYHRSDGATIINPARLGEEVERALDAYVERMRDQRVLVSCAVLGASQGSDAGTE